MEAVQKKAISARKLPQRKIHDKKALISFLDKLEIISPRSPLLMVVSPFYEKFKIAKFPLALNDLYQYEYSSLPLEVIGCNLNFDWTSTDISNIEERTRHQLKTSEWLVFWAGRITASKTRAVCHVRLDSSISLIKSLCYPSKYGVRTAAIQWGYDHEKDALQAYLQLLNASHTDISLKMYSLFVHPRNLCIAASPDAIMSCVCCGVGTVEVKCPFCLVRIRVL